jgi:hypothetical protein
MSASLAFRTAQKGNSSPSTTIRGEHDRQLEQKRDTQDAHLPDGLKRISERALAKPWVRELGAPEQVGVAKHELDRRRARAVKRVRRANATTRGKDINQDLDVESPVARVVEDKDGGNGDVGEHDLWIRGRGEQ